MIKLNIDPLLKKNLRSRYWLARQLGISDFNLKRMATGKTVMIRFDTIEALCQILDCTPNDLFEIVNE